MLDAVLFFALLLTAPLGIETSRVVVVAFDVAILLTAPLGIETEVKKFMAILDLTF